MKGPIAEQLRDWVEKILNARMRTHLFGLNIQQHESHFPGAQSKQYTVGRRCAIQGNLCYWLLRYANAINTQQQVQLVCSQSKQIQAMPK